ncbi:hypothetical protein SMA5143A_8197 [Streptomyces sp. MA5143a]|nr:hypothetical protein SMA5143A_8197 [Streptomyces sp. MA5143a]
MPRSIYDILAQAALPDAFTDADVADLKQEVVREVTATLMFGTGQPPRDASRPCWSAPTKPPGPGR